MIGDSCLEISHNLSFNITFKYAWILDLAKSSFYVKFPLVALYFKHENCQAYASDEHFMAPPLPKMMAFYCTKILFCISGGEWTLISNMT